MRLMAPRVFFKREPLIEERKRSIVTNFKNPAGRIIKRIYIIAEVLVTRCFTSMIVCLQDVMPYLALKHVSQCCSCQILGVNKSVKCREIYDKEQKEFTSDVVVGN
jgi:hypothetical protein